MEWSSFFTGIITTVFCALFVLIWKKLVIPWWQDRGYGGLRLNKIWVADISAADGKFSITLDLSQKSHDITGILKITKTFTEGETSQISELKVRGCILESFVQLRCKSINNDKLSFSVFMLKVEESGNKLNGIYAFRDLKADGIKCIDIGFCHE